MSKRRVYVKPVTNKTEVFGWLVLELTILEALADDWRRYGAVTAVRNWFKTALLERNYFNDND